MDDHTSKLWPASHRSASRSPHCWLRGSYSASHCAYWHQKTFALRFFAAHPIWHSNWFDSYSSVPHESAHYQQSKTLRSLAIWIDETWHCYEILVRAWTILQRLPCFWKSSWNACHHGCQLATLENSSWHFEWSFRMRCHLASCQQP
jgi:hypothetical protein